MPSSRMSATCSKPVSSKQVGRVPILLELLGKVEDPRALRGRRHSASALIAVAVCAVLTNAQGFTAIAERARDAGRRRLARIGITRGAADEATFRRSFARLDANLLDLLPCRRRRDARCATATSAR